MFCLLLIIYLYCQIGWMSSGFMKRDLLFFVVYTVLKKNLIFLEVFYLKGFSYFLINSHINNFYSNGMRKQVMI